MNKIRFGTSLVLALGLIGFARATIGAGQYLKIDYPASTATNELQVAVTYTLWIPDGVKTIRGIIVHQHGAGTTASIEGSTAASDLHWQALAKKWDCALLGISSYHARNEKDRHLPPEPRNCGSIRATVRRKTFLKALGEFAASRSAMPKLIDKVPWALWGHSGGGILEPDVMAYRCTPIIASPPCGCARGRHSCFSRIQPDLPQIITLPEAVYRIPHDETNPGVKEKPQATAAEAETTRTAAEKR